MPEVSVDELPPTARMIAAARKALGLSRERFAKRVGVARCTVKGWEQGRRIPTDTRFEQIEQLLTQEGVDLRVMEGIDG